RAARQNRIEHGLNGLGERVEFGKSSGHAGRLSEECQGGAIVSHKRACKVRHEFPLYLACFAVIAREVFGRTYPVFCRPAATPLTDSRSSRRCSSAAPDPSAV